MLCVLEFKEEEKFEIVQGLTQLFQEVDINDDKHMEWKEFTQYIIDSVMINKPNSKKNESKSKSEKGVAKKKLLDISMEIEMPNGGGDFFDDENYDTNQKGSESNSEEDDEEDSQGHRKKAKKSKGTAHVILSQSLYRHFDHSLTLYDHVSHPTNIQQSVYSEKLNGMLTLESRQRNFKLYSKEGVQK